MSGARDGTPISFSHQAGNGVWEGSAWAIRIGRNSDNDLTLNDDDFSSGNHASLLQTPAGWLLQDHNSTNGTFIDVGGEDERLPKLGSVTLHPKQLFRVGRTWLRIDPTDDDPSE